ncbi:MFS transporter [Terrilactibacillus sp. S3-3]|nr:MFS transporter [Terrilactibacillus sp. S3-3]
MVIGRAATSWIIRKITYSRFLLFSIIGALVSLILFILCKSAATGYLFIGMLGLMMSGIFSITMVYANHSLPDHSRLVTSLITGFSGLGSAIIPALAGLSMDRSGTAVTLWFITIIAAAYLVFLLIVNIMQSSGWKPLSKPLAARASKTARKTGLTISKHRTPDRCCSRSYMPLSRITVSKTPISRLQ